MTTSAGKASKFCEQIWKVLDHIANNFDFRRFVTFLRHLTEFRYSTLKQATAYSLQILTYSSFIIICTSYSTRTSEVENCH